MHELIYYLHTQGYIITTYEMQANKYLRKCRKHVQYIMSGIYELSGYKLKSLNWEKGTKNTFILRIGKRS